MVTPGGSCVTGFDPRTCRWATQPSAGSGADVHGSFRMCFAAIRWTLSTRMTYLGTSARNSVDIHARTVSRASADPMIFPPRQRTLVSECDRASVAQNGSWHTAAYTPWILFAIIALA